MGGETVPQDMLASLESDAGRHEGGCVELPPVGVGRLNMNPADAVRSIVNDGNGQDTYDVLYESWCSE